MKSNKYILLASLFLFLTACHTKANNSSSNNPIDGNLLTVHFDACTELETNIIPDQRLEAGSLVQEPAVVTPMEDKLNMKITGWYQENSYVNKWNFLTDTVEKDMTLYAKWAETITINYFLKGSKTPIWTVTNAAKGEPLELHDELCDGYKFLGYYSDSDCTEPFDLNKPLEYTTTVYMSRGDVMTYNASAIKRRFGMYAASGHGSREGNISQVQIGADGVSYVDINFGYSTSSDPFMRTNNPQIDISKSQKVGLKFKNFGNASSIGFYWISRYENGNYSANVNYESEDNGIHVKLNDNEKNMTEDGPWVEKVVDLAAKTTSGVSGWGNSVTMVSLRIQFEYVSKNERDLSNAVRLAEIYGVSDDTHVGFKDSEEIRNMLNNDSEGEIAAAKATQTQNRGVIFPLDEECVSQDSSTYYMKKDGILIYSTYDTDINRFIFDVSNQHIDASAYSYVTLKMKNLSYVSSLIINVVTTSPITGRPTSNNASISIGKRMAEKDLFTVNLYGRNNMVGEISQISLNFSVNGVDNAMLIDSITLSENQPFQIPGINFDDLYTAGFSSNSNVTLTYNKTLRTTSFVTTNDAQISNHLDFEFETISYKDISLKYYYVQEGISSVIVTLTYKNGETGSYTFTGFSITNSLQTLTLPLTEEGSLSDVSIEFQGVGRIDISEIRFSLDGENACDLSSSKTFNSFLPDWSIPLSYIDDKQATLYNAQAVYARYYFGYLYRDGRRDYPNISLANKTKVYIIYQNQKPTCGLFINVYAVDKRTNSEYLTTISESAPIIDSVRPDLSMSMDNRSWKVASIDIPSQYCNENYYVTNIGFGISYSADNTIYLRGVVFR